MEESAVEDSSDVAAYHANCDASDVHLPITSDKDKNKCKVDETHSAVDWANFVGRDHPHAEPYGEDTKGTLPFRHG